MAFLAITEEGELELADEEAVARALREGRIGPESWIKEADLESEWEPVEELLPMIVASMENNE